MCENTNNILPGVAIRLYTQDMKWIIREVEVSRTSCSIVAIRLAAYHRALNHLYKIQYLFLCWLAGVSGWWWLFHLNKHVILQRTRNCCQPTFPYLPQEFKGAGGRHVRRHVTGRINAILQTVKKIFRKWNRPVNHLVIILGTLSCAAKKLCMCARLYWWRNFGVNFNLPRPR